MMVREHIFCLLCIWQKNNLGRHFFNISEYVLHLLELMITKKSTVVCKVGQLSRKEAVEVILLILAQPRSQPATFASRSSIDLSKLSSEVLRLRLHQLNLPVMGNHARLVGDPGLCFFDCLISISIAPTATLFRLLSRSPALQVLVSLLYHL